ncbi:MAG: hypothetical protein RSE65_09700, partial [Hafnia sp.]
RVESPRATGLSSVAFASGFMETRLLTGERNISLQPHRGLAFQTGAGMASRIKARECRDHALVVSARTPSRMYQ